MSNARTIPATMNAPGQGKTIGIQAGESRSTHVISPGAASKSRAPKWRMAWSRAAAAGLVPGREAIRSRLWLGPRAGSDREYAQVWRVCILYAKHEALRRPDVRGRRAQGKRTRNRRLLRRVVRPVPAHDARHRAAGGGACWQGDDR